MLICNYKVRCISFDNFEELNNWVEILKTYLTCNYFHADLILASKESSLYGYARQRRRQLHQATASHKQSSTSTNPSAGTAIFRASCTVRDDGYLHVTRDRICFTTSPGCTRPRLLATWSFDNDELIQCCTGRMVRRDSDDSDRVNLFCLTASADHPEAPGGHLFISDRATELCDWIEANNQTAVYQAEWRRLTSMVATLDSPFTSSLSFNSGPACSPAAANFGDYTSLFNMDDASGPSKGDQARYCMSQRASVPTESVALPGEVSQAVSHDQPIQASVITQQDCNRNAELSSTQAQLDNDCDVSPTSNLSTTANTGKQEDELNIVDHADSTDELKDHAPTNRVPVSSAAASVSTESDSKPEVKFVFPNASAQAEFLARKRIAMHSRRRFSSQPVDTHCPPPVLLSSKGHSSCSTGSNSLPGAQQDPAAGNGSNDCGRHGAENLGGLRPLCSQWRQSEPQLVTLPPFPVPIHELKDFLHRYKCALSQHSSLMSPPVVLAQQPSEMLTADDGTANANQRNSQCSSCRSGASSSHQPGHCLQCDNVGDGLADTTEPSTTVRKRLPSGWSNNTCSSMPIPGDTASPGQWFSPNSTRNSTSQNPLSNENSPNCSLSPLLPTAGLIPGSQHFNRRRKHAASASEAFPSVGTTRPIMPVRQRAVSIMDQRCTTAAPGNSASGRLSLNSLSPLSAPVWADPPVFAKPRTGHNYVSRDAIITSYMQRKLRGQQQASAPSGQLPRQPPSTGPHNSPPATPPETSHSEAPSIPAGAAHHPLRTSTNQSVTGESQSVIRTTSPLVSPCISHCSPTSTTPLCVDATCQNDNAGCSPRPYVNMAPGSARHVGLQPIAESQPMLPTSTGPGARSQCHGAQLSSTSTSQSATTLPSYVNVPPPPHTMDQRYVNVGPTSSTVSTGFGRGLRSIPTHMELYGLQSKSSAPNLNNDGGASTTSLFTASNTNNPGDLTTSHRLHYALLTLSTSASPVRSTNAALTQSVPSCSTTNAVLECRGNLHNVHSTSCASGSVDAASTDDGLNYVTIDLAQTKALSELEQELRSSTGGGGEIYHTNRTNWSFRSSHPRRGLANSAMLSAEADENTRTRLSQNPHTKPGSTDISITASALSLPARMFNRLVQSIHFQASNRRSDNQTSQRRGSLLTRKTGATPASSSKATSSLGV